MKKAIWPIVALVAIFALGFVVAVMVTDHAAQRATIRTQAATSAAQSITVFLLLVILLLGILAVGVGALYLWAKRRRRRAELEDAYRQAQVYALLNGAKVPTPSRGAPGLPQGGGPIIVMGSGGAPSQWPTQQQITLDDLARAVQAAQGQGAPFGGLLPPTDQSGGWRIE